MSDNLGEVDLQGLDEGTEESASDVAESDQGGNAVQSDDVDTSNPFDVLDEDLVERLHVDPASAVQELKGRLKEDYKNRNRTFTKKLQSAAEFKRKFEQKNAQLEAIGSKLNQLSESNPDLFARVSEALSGKSQGTSKMPSIKSQEDLQKFIDDKIEQARSEFNTKYAEDRAIMDLEKIVKKDSPLRRKALEFMLTTGMTARQAVAAADPAAYEAAVKQKMTSKIPGGDRSTVSERSIPPQRRAKAKDFGSAFDSAVSKVLGD